MGVAKPDGGHRGGVGAFFQHRNKLGPGFCGVGRGFGERIGGAADRAYDQVGAAAARRQHVEQVEQHFKVEGQQPEFAVEPSDPHHFGGGVALSVGMRLIQLRIGVHRDAEQCVGGGFHPEFHGFPRPVFRQLIQLLPVMGAENRAGAEAELRHTRLIEQHRLAAESDPQRQRPAGPLLRQLRGEPEPTRIPGIPPLLPFADRPELPVQPLGERDGLDGMPHLRRQRNGFKKEVAAQALLEFPGALKIKVELSLLHMLAPDYL